MSRHMVKFKWSWLGKDLTGRVLEHRLSTGTKESVKWYATLRYFTSSGKWHLLIRDWDDWMPTDFVEVKKPVKEYVENLVLLAFNTGVRDG